MPCKPVLTVSLVALLLATLATNIASAQLVPTKEFPTPPHTDWTPAGCRDFERRPRALSSQATLRNIHGGPRSSDEIQRATAPVFESDWQTEMQTYNPTGPVFDSDGYLYFVPLLPYEPVVLISLDPADGSRRWAIPATTEGLAGFSTPVVLRDPTNKEAEAIFVVLADRALAVRPDGSVIWDVPAGFPNVAQVGIMGVQYHGPTDSIVAVSTDGFLVGLDRKTGAPTFGPVELPGEPSPIPEAAELPPEVALCLGTKLFQLTNLAALGAGPDFLINILLGNGNEVANSFSIDPNTGRIWIAATAPDDVDGTVDGVSEFGALYRIDIRRKRGGGHQALSVCRTDFDGGSASTPSLKADGSRVYVGDNFGSLLSIDAKDCSVAWSVDVGAQIFASVAVASDNDELYASTAQSIRQVFDRGDHAELGWTGNSEVFDVPAALQPVLSHFNLLGAGIAANGITALVGVGVDTGSRQLPVSQAVVFFDRETGEPLWASEGLDESVAVTSMGPDGAVYIGNSPIRRIVTRCFLEVAAAGLIPPVFPIPPGVSIDAVTPPITGGVTKYAPQRLDLLVRDATCAAADRAANAAYVEAVCEESVEADVRQIRELARQAREASAVAIADGDMTAREWNAIRERLRNGLKALRFWRETGETAALDKGARELGRACDLAESH